MALLMDTNVVSELRKKSRCNPAVAAWQLEISGQELFISVISLMEIKQGVLAAKRKDARLAELLNEWYEAQVKPAFDGCVLFDRFPHRGALRDSVEPTNPQSRGRADRRHGLCQRSDLGHQEYGRFCGYRNTPHKPVEFTKAMTLAHIIVAFGPTTPWSYGVTGS